MALTACHIPCISHTRIVYLQTALPHVASLKILTISRAIMKPILLMRLGRWQVTMSNSCTPLVESEDSYLTRTLAFSLTLIQEMSRLFLDLFF